MTTFRDTSFVAVGCNGAVSRNLSVRGNKNNRSIVKEDIYITQRIQKKARMENLKKIIIKPTEIGVFENSSG